jgi:hypothetical protein
MDIAKDITKPFTDRNIDVVGLALGVGVVIVAAWAWIQILRPVKDVVETVVEGAADVVSGS